MMISSRVVIGLMKMAQNGSIAQAADIMERAGADRDKAFKLLQNQSFLVKLAQNLNNGADNDLAVLSQLAKRDPLVEPLISQHDEVIAGEMQRELVRINNITSTSDTSSEMAAIYNLFVAVKKSEPSMTYFAPGAFVRRITDDGLWMWERIKEGFSMSKPIGPDTYFPLAHLLRLPSRDDMSDLTLACARSWVGLYKKLTGIKARLARSQEWERATAINYSIISLGEQLRSDKVAVEKLNQDYFLERKLANPFVEHRGNLVEMGGSLLHEPGQNLIDVASIKSLLSDGVRVYVWDFGSPLDNELTFDQGLESVQLDTHKNLQFRIAVSHPDRKEVKVSKKSPLSKLRVA